MKEGISEERHKIVIDGHEFIFLQSTLGRVAGHRGVVGSKEQQQADGRTDGRTGGRTGRADGRAETDGWTDGRTDRRTDGRADG